MSKYTVPGLSGKDGTKVAGVLQQRLSAYNDLHLTLKHIHWNVVGPNFIGVHEMIDPQVELVRGYADEVAERIATLGESSNTFSGNLLVQLQRGEESGPGLCDGPRQLGRCGAECPCPQGLWRGPRRETRLAA